MVWTRFMDMHSGGGCKTGYEYIYIEQSEDDAIKTFERVFGQSPYDIACNCCGNNFSVNSGYKSIEDASEFERRWDKTLVEDYLIRKDIKVIYNEEI